MITLHAMLTRTTDPIPAAHDRVYRTIRARIMHGEIEPGQAMTLRGIGKEFDVSMTPAREAVRRLVAEAGDHLSSGGWLGIELSPEQADEVEGLLTEAGFTDVERRFDLASRARVVGARWP